MRLFPESPVPGSIPWVFPGTYRGICRVWTNQGIFVLRYVVSRTERATTKLPSYRDGPKRTYWVEGKGRCFVKSSLSSGRAECSYDNREGGSAIS